MWDEEARSDTVIGRIKAHKLLLGLGATEGWNVLLLFGATQYTLNIGEG